MVCPVVVVQVHEKSSGNVSSAVAHGVLIGRLLHETGRLAKMAKMVDQKVWELLTELQLNGVLKRRKRGSSQLGGVSNA